MATFASTATAIPFDSRYQSPYNTAVASTLDRDRLVGATNSYRVANGLKPLVHDLASSGRTDTYALQLANRFDSHSDETCPDVPNDPAFTHDTDANIKAAMPAGATSVAENIAFRCSLAFEGVVGAAFFRMKLDDATNAKMLDPKYTHIAVSVVHKGANTFLVQRFATAPAGGGSATGTNSPRLQTRTLCMAGRGRVDVSITNTTGIAGTYKLTYNTNLETINRDLEIAANKTVRTTLRLVDAIYAISVAPASDTTNKTDTNTKVRCD